MNMNEAISLLQENGFKMTKRREDILTFFAKEDKYHSAKALYEHMESIYPGISFDTVYRNLHLYHDLGILESTDLHAEKHFRMNCGATTTITISFVINAVKRKKLIFVQWRM